LVVRPRDLSLLPELARHFERSGFRAELRGETIAVGRRPDALDDEQAVQEIERHLKVWLLMYPDSIVSP